MLSLLFARGGVEDTRLEAKDTKTIQGQGQPFRGQTRSRPRTGILEAKTNRGCEYFREKYFREKRLSER